MSYWLRTSVFEEGSEIDGVDAEPTLIKICINLSTVDAFVEITNSKHESMRRKVSVISGDNEYCLNMTYEQFYKHMTKSGVIYNSEEK